MAAFLTASLVLFVLVSTFSVSAGQRIITAKPGDNVILTCRAPENKDIIVVLWNRTDLGSDQYVLLYRDSQLGKDFQSPSFSNRVDLLDVKNGDVSLVLKNVTSDDTGTYECRVVQGGNNRRKRSIQDYKPISTFNLIVEPGNQDGGNKDRQKEDGGINTGLIVGIICGLLALASLALNVHLYRTRRPLRQEKKSRHRAETEPLNIKKHPQLKTKHRSIISTSKKSSTL